MLSTPPLVQAQLSDALSIICEHDFPEQVHMLLSIIFINDVSS